MKIDLENIYDSIKYGDKNTKYIFEVFGIKRKRMFYLIDRMDEVLNEKNPSETYKALKIVLSTIEEMDVNEVEAFSLLMNFFYVHGMSIAELQYKQKIQN